MFKHIGITDYSVAVLALNIVCIDIAILFIYKSGSLLMGGAKAIFILLFCMASATFTLYVPLPGKAVMLLPFTAIVLYFWLRGRQCWRIGNAAGTVKRFVGLSVLSGVAVIISPLFIIVWLAIALDCIFMLVGSARWFILLFGMLGLGITWLVLCLLLQQVSVWPQAGTGNAMPFTHWLMMGLSGTGTANAADESFTLAAATTKAARNTAVVSEISQRLSALGALGVIGQLGKKLAVLFGDGTNGAAALIYPALAENTGLLAQLVQPFSSYAIWLASVSFLAHGALLVGNIAGAIKCFFRKNDALTFVRIALVLLVLFQLLWAASPVYLVPFMPLLLLATLEALPVKSVAIIGGADGPTALLIEGETATTSKQAKRRAAKKTAAQKNQSTDEIAMLDEMVAFSLEEEPNAAVSEGTAQTEDLFSLEDDFSGIGAEITVAPDAPEKNDLFAKQTQGTIVVETVHTQNFDVPVGDPFYNLASTASWKVSEVLPVAAAQAAEQDNACSTQSPAETAAAFAEPPAAPAVSSVENATHTPQVPVAPAIEEEETPEATPVDTSAPAQPADEPPPMHYNDAFSRAAMAAWETADAPPTQAPLPQDVQGAQPNNANDAAPATLQAAANPDLFAAEEEQPQYAPPSNNLFDSLFDEE